jgi:hypothetical protein
MAGRNRDSLNPTGPGRGDTLALNTASANSDRGSHYAATNRRQTP